MDAHWLLVYRYKPPTDLDFAFRRGIALGIPHDIVSASRRIGVGLGSEG